MTPRPLSLLFALCLVACGGSEGVDAGPDAARPPDAGLRDAGPPPPMDAALPDAGPPPTCTDAPSGDAVPTGALVAWQPLSFRFAGPPSREDGADPNPFLDHRLDVTVTAPSGRTWTVPGFFDGDGAGGSDGDAWVVRFSPQEPGEHTWTARFLSGPGVAVADDVSGATPGALDGSAGRFCVDAPDPGAPGIHARGLLGYVGAHHLRFADGTWWLKGGTDSPENFLGYAGFDGAMDQPGGTDTTGLVDGLHRYGPHVADWSEGDPDWGGGAGRGIIGALNYLASEEVNSIYFLPCNLGGDGRDTYPYLAPDDLTHLDVSRLAQWEIVLAHAERLGIALHVVLNETEAGNENLHDGGTLGPQRRLYYRELVARFAHHQALFWNIGEENDYGATRQREFAAHLRALDPYDHPITVHTHVNRPGDQYDALVGDPSFELTSIQLSPDRADQYTEQWRRQSALAARPWVVMLDEIAPAGTGVTDTNAAQIRRQTLWPAYLSGAGGVEWYFGYHPLPLGGDVRAEDFRTRADMWRFTRIARRFVEDNLPFWRMEPDDALSSVGAEVFVDEASIYAIYLADASPSGTLDLTGIAGEFEVAWFDPRTGTFAAGTTTVTAGGPVDLGAPPSDPDEDWVVLVTGDGTVTGGPTGPTVTGLVLVDAETDADIGPLLLDAVVSVPAGGINVRAEVAGGVGSVRFGLDGDANHRTESSVPFSLEGDIGGDYAPWRPAPGVHTITATPFAEANAMGAMGDPVSVRFTVE